MIGVPATRTQQAGRPDEPQEPQSAPRGWNVTLLGCYLVLAALPFVGIAFDAQASKCRR